MSRVRRPILAVVAALTALALAGPAHARVPAGWVGVMADGPLLGSSIDLPAETRLMRGAGAGSVRVAFYWRELQENPGPIDWGPTDRAVEAAARAGLDVLPILVRSPWWAVRDEAGEVDEGSVPDPALYGAFVAETVRRYGPQGTFWAANPALPRAPIRRWQVWNEPDIRLYLDPPRGTSWPQAYVRLLRAAAEAIRREDPGATVVAAGLTNRSWVDLARLYGAGARRWFDAAAIHPFSRRVANVVKIVRLARAEMRRRGDARKPLLLTEVSWSSGRGHSTRNYGWETTERGQAERVRQALTALARERRRLRIGGVWWYTWLSPAIGDRRSFSYAGLRRMSGGRPVSKPALTAFRRTVRRLRAR